MLPLLMGMFLSFSACSLVFPAKVAIDIPPRPMLEACPPKPAVQGIFKDGSVVIPLADAKRLRDWISAYTVCAESNEARALGHIEKLENRLKAVGGK